MISSRSIGYMCMLSSTLISFFFFNDTATTEIYTLSLHDALPILPALIGRSVRQPVMRVMSGPSTTPDRKSTRLNSSHTVISYAVFCLKKKKNGQTRTKKKQSCCAHIDKIYT